MNELQIFENKNFGKLGIWVENGKEYFPATEVAVILGYKDPHKAINTHCREDGWVIRPVINKKLKKEVLGNGKKEYKQSEGGT